MDLTRGETKKLRSWFQVVKSVIKRYNLPVGRSNLIYYSHQITGTSNGILSKSYRQTEFEPKMIDKLSDRTRWPHNIQGYMKAQKKRLRAHECFSIPKSIPLLATRCKPYKEQKYIKMICY